MNTLRGLKSAGGLRAGAAFAVGGVLAVLFFSGAAVANTYNYTKAKNGYLGISNLGMVPNKGAGDYDNSPSSGLSVFAFKCFSRSINLPDGAIIKNLIVLCKSATFYELLQFMQLFLR